MLNYPPLVIQLRWRRVPYVCEVYATALAVGNRVWAGAHNKKTSAVPPFPFTRGARPPPPMGCMGLSPQMGPTVPRPWARPQRSLALAKPLAQSTPFCLAPKLGGWARRRGRLWLGGPRSRSLGLPRASIFVCVCVCVCVIV